MKSYSVSIIVPIYNVEQYIERCVVSLFEQDFENIEYIFVNDCTPDNSMDILKSVIEQYPNRKSNCKIIELENNEGVWRARKTGVENASGDYVIHIDSDDWVEKNMISAMYAEAELKNLDIVICDYYEDYVNKSVKIHSNSKDILQSLLNGELNSYLWRMLVRKDLYANQDVFTDERMLLFEDMYLLTRLSFYANKIGFLNLPLYHYNKTNINSITSNIKQDEMNSMKYCLVSIDSFLKDKGLFEKYKQNFYTLLMLQYHYFALSYDDFLYENYPDAVKLKYLWRAKIKFKTKILKILFYLSPQFLREFGFELNRKLKK